MWGGHRWTGGFKKNLCLISEEGSPLFGSVFARGGEREKKGFTGMFRGGAPVFIPLEGLFPGGAEK